MMRVFIEGIGLCGPGLNGWGEARAILAGLAPYVPEPVLLPSVALLPAAERRRAVPIVKLAMAVGTEALTQAGRDASETATVFASSGGDGDTIHEILRVLATDEREVSPTRFHNSVHNAPSGYWTIATGSREPSTSLCAFDASFAAGLLEAAAQVTVEECTVAFICYDLPYPQPLYTARAVKSIFGTALVLAPQRGNRTLGELAIKPGDDAAECSHLDAPGLELIRGSNPAARSLPLLAALARGSAETIQIEGTSATRIEIAVIPP